MTEVESALGGISIRADLITAIIICIFSKTIIISISQRWTLKVQEVYYLPRGLLKPGCRSRSADLLGMAVARSVCAGSLWRVVERKG